MGASPESIAGADFNGDGRADLAVANSGVASPGTTGVSVLLGNGDGSFAAATNLTAGTNPISVTAGDFNADGKIDLAVANLNSSDVSVFIGKGDATFQPAVNYATTPNQKPLFVTVGDFNGDGLPDLVAMYQMGGLTILTGTGAGTFSPGVDTSAGVGGRKRAVLGDFNGDGKTDVATADDIGWKSQRVAPGIQPATTSCADGACEPVDLWSKRHADGDGDSFGGNGGGDILCGQRCFGNEHADSRTGFADREASLGQSFAEGILSG